MSKPPEPQTWEEYRGNRLEVDWVRERIKHTPDPEAKQDLPPVMFITGASGTGKGTLAQLTVKTVQCLNRAFGEDKPCNECANCRRNLFEANELSNVVWVETGKMDTTDHSKVKDAINAATKGPRGNKHQDVLFVVFDECHLLSQRQLSALLTTSQSCSYRVKFICITAQPEKIDNEVFFQTFSRGKLIQLMPPDREMIKQYLTDCFGGAPAETLEVIAVEARQSYRFAAMIYQQCQDVDPEMRVDNIVRALHYTTKQERRRLWEAIEQGNRKQVMDRYYALTNEKVALPLNLAKQMLRDVETSLGAKGVDTDAQIRAVTALRQYLENAEVVDLVYYLLTLRGENIVTELDTTHPTVEETIQEQMSRYVSE